MSARRGMGRKTPVLLRRAPLTGRIMVLTNYRWVKGGKILSVVGDGKHDVSADYDSLVLTELIDNGADDIVATLDGVADGQEITDAERYECRVLRERLKEMIERHNARHPK